MKRWLLTILLFLLLGAVVNVAVAWFAFAFESPPRGRWHDVVHADSEVEALVSRAWPFEGSPAAISESRGSALDVIRLTWGSGMTRDSIEWRAGWPMRSVTGCETASMAEDEPAPTDGIVVVRLPVTGRTRLLLQPILGGFVLNTLFYAALLWLPIWGPSALRRQIRKRRGRCPKCGYPLGASPTCTECGTAFPMRRPKE